MIDAHTLAGYLEEGKRPRPVIQRIDEVAVEVGRRSGLAFRFPKHNHEFAPDRLPDPGRNGMQFLLQEPFDLPSPDDLNVRIRNALRTVGRGLYYLTFTASHAWQYDRDQGFPAHLRWGLAIEVGDKYESVIQPVFRYLLRERLALRPKIQVVATCPVAGFVKPASKPSLWLHFLGQRITAKILRSEWTMERICEEAGADLQAIYRAVTT
ncbi:MAG: hypothetical protein V2A73_03675 [Pseudomonadota bacterium]